MTDITIPPEALEAAAKTLCRERHPCWSIVAEIFETDRDGQATEFRSLARAVILATLETWPGASGELSDKGNPHIILPLTENTNAEG